MYKKRKTKIIMRYITWIFILITIVNISVEAEIVPASGDFINYSAVEEATEAGWKANYGSRLGVVKTEDGYAVEARGASHHGGLSWFPARLDLTGAKKLRYKIRQNVHRLYSFTWVLQFENGLKNVAVVSPGGAGWNKWQEVELDLTSEKLGQLRKIGIYASCFKETEDKYLQLDKLRFVVPEKESKIELPILTVPQIDSPPIINGLMGENEWTNSAITTGFVIFGTGALSDRQTQVYISYDAKYLYLAYISDYFVSGDFYKGKSGILDKSDLAGNQDFLELWLNDGKQLHRQFMINMNGGVFERSVHSNTPSKTGVEAVSTLTPNNYLNGGGWLLELRIPFKGLGVQPPVEGERWKALFCRDYAGIGSSRSGKDWTSSVYTEGDFNNLETFGLLQFSSSLPCVRVQKLGAMSEGEIILSGNLRSKEYHDVKAHIKATGTDTGTLFDKEIALSVAPGDNNFVLGEEVKTDVQTESLYQINIMNHDGSPIYRNNFKFLLGTPLRLKCVSLAKTGDILVDISANKVKNLTADNIIKITLTNSKSAIPVLETSFKYSRTQKRVLHQVDCNKLNKGFYKVRADIINSNGTVLASSSQQEVWAGIPVWANNNIGVSEQVPSPWEPIKVTGTKVTVSQRKYNIGNNGLPVSINAIGKQILAKPTKLLINTQFGVEKCSFNKLVRLSASPTKVVWQIRGESRSFKISGTLSLEYDGFALWQIDFEPISKLKIQDISIVFELPKKRSLYARGKTMGSTSGGYAACLPKDREKSVFKLAKTIFSSSGWHWENQFFYEFFIGDDNSGITLMNQSPQFHNGKKHIVIKDNNLTRTLTVHLTSDHSINTKQSLHYEYAWIGLPLKPRPSNPKAWHVSIGPTGKVDEHPDEIPREFYEYCPIVIGGRMTRYDSHYQVIDPDPAKRLPRRAGYQWPDVIELITKMNKMGSKVIADGIYWADADSGCPEAKKFLEEWKLIGGGVSYYNYHNTLDVGACPNSSWLDFQCYVAKRLLENGINGVYLDVSSEFPCSNPYHGCGYIDKNGVRRRTINLWSVRELHKRVYTYYQSQRPTGVIYHHHLDSAAWSGFCDGGFQGEEWAAESSNPRGEEYKDMTPEFFRTMSFTQYGTPYTWFALFSYYQITQMNELMAICLPHRIYPAIWNVRDKQWPKIKPYWDIMDDWWTNSDFVGYWQDNHPADVNYKNVLVSAYIKNEELLLVISNWNYDDLSDIDIILKPSIANKIGTTSVVTDLLSKQLIGLESLNKFTISIDSRTAKIVHIK